VATEVTYQLAPLEKLSPHPANPRKRFPEAQMLELTQSILDKGVLVPLLVRPNGAGFEILAGERRYRAAKRAGLAEVPVIVRQINDADALELILIDNLQREDLSPLEEAEGYKQLMLHGRYDVARIAERIGRSVKYIYDRVKLVQLIPQAKTLLAFDRITAGHAILLARLKPDEQKRAIDPDSGGLFQDENAEQFDFDKEGFARASAQATAKDPQDLLKYYGLKARSVRELEGWIDQHVRFDRTAPIAQDLFPETAATVKKAVEVKEKIVQVTHNHFTMPDAKGGNTERIYHVSSWTLADGSKGNKECERSVTGVIVVGPDRGKAFKVCIDKKRCSVHWAREQRQAAPGGDVTQRERYAEQTKAEADRNRWKKALPAILKAVAEKVKKAPARAKGFLADLIIKACTPTHYGMKVDRDSLPRGTTAEDLVRHAAFLVLQDEAQDWRGLQEFPKRAKALGVDTREILDEVALMAAPETEPPKPVQTSAKKVRKARKAGKAVKAESGKAGKPAKAPPRKKTSKKAKVQTSAGKTVKKKAAAKTP